MKPFTRIDPLTEAEQRYAEDHYGLVNTFLSIHHLPADTFWDVVIFGYLRAVKRYLTEENLRQWQFSTIAKRAMSCTVHNYYAAQGKPCRSGAVYSLDSVPEDGVFPDLYDILPGSSPNPAAYYEGKSIVRDAFSRLTSEQRRLVSMRDQGYEDEELPLVLGWSKEKVENHARELVSLFSGDPGAA